MSTLLLSSAILVSYPEHNPFEIDPPIYNLPPNPTNWQLEISYDTPEFRAATLAQSIKLAYNPLWPFFGVNPFFLFDERLKSADLPFKDYVAPPPLPQAQLSSPISFIEQINPKGNTRMYKVQIGEDIRLLKLFLDKDMNDEYGHEEVQPPIRLFHREQQAYAHLLHYGICDKGIVPYCFGWFDLSQKDIDTLLAFAASSGTDYYIRTHLERHRVHRPPKCILLEYFADAVNLTNRNITMAIAEKAMRSIYEVHTAYIEHGDVHCRNILLLAGDRIVWVDFDSSIMITPSESEEEDRPKLTRQRLMEEMYYLWGMLYAGLLPDSRIVTDDTPDEGAISQTSANLSPPW